jgi:hypothetical protein
MIEPQASAEILRELDATSSLTDERFRHLTPSDRTTGMATNEPPARASTRERALVSAIVAVRSSEPGCGGEATT